VYNVGANAVYVKLGTSNAVTATTSDDYISAGGALALTVGSNTYIAAITATSTSTLNVSGGAGLPTGWCGGGGGGGGGTVTQGTAAASGPWIFTPWIAGAVNSATNGLYDNLLQGNAVLSATNGLYSNLLQGNVALSLTNPLFAASPIGPTVTNPTSTLTLTSATTAYAIGNLIASSATAGSVVVPSFAIATSGGAAVINKLLLTSNDSTSTAWGSAQIQVDLWTTAPTFTNGDRAAFVVATGTAAHRAAFTCTMSPEYGDGVYGECTPNFGSEAVKLGSGTTVYWTLQALTLSGVTGVSKVFTLTAELLN